MPFERPKGYINTFAYFIIFENGGKKWVGFNIIARKENTVSGIKEYIDGPYLILNEPPISITEEGCYFIKEMDYYKERKNHDKAFVILLGCNNDILMLHYYENELYKERYGFPGGHIEPNEPAILAAIREANEEAGIKLCVENLKFVHFLNIFKKREEDIRKYFYFVARDWEGELNSAEPYKYSIEWHDIYTLPEKTAPHIKQVVNCIIENIPYSLLDYDY